MRRRVSWLIFSVLGAIFFLILTGTIVRSYWIAPLANRSPVVTAGTAFTYQGHLVDGEGPANGLYDFVFSLHDDQGAGVQVGPDVTVTDQLVAEGQFSVLLDFEQGNETVFDGTALWLEIQVRSDGNESDPYSTLSPRQPLSPAPYAIYASRAEWRGLLNLPPDFADEIDDNTTYLAGPGLVLSETTFVLSSTYQLPQTCASGQLASWNGSGWSCAAPGSGIAGWSLTGNAGTTAGTNFLGTTDDQALQLHVNGQRALLLEPDASSPRFAAGYDGNSAIGSGATVGGGGRDLAVNQAGGDYSTVDGGEGNQAGGYASAVGGGEGNLAANNYTTIGGGSANDTGGDYATVAGGQGNTAGAVGTTIGGGTSNAMIEAYGTIAGGVVNSATASYAAIGGGTHNTVVGSYGTIAGGGPSDLGNPITSNNRVYDDYGVVSGGGGNVAGNADDDPTSSLAAVVGGGADNTAGAGYATASGGLDNTAGAYGSVVGGGVSNNAGANYATVAGGTGNSSSATYATIAGGSGNRAGTRASVGGGQSNAADGAFSTVAGGFDNEISASYGTIPGGIQNQVGADYGFAAGHQAQAQHQGSFVWSDSTSGAFASTGQDQFLIQAAGGVAIGTNEATPTRTLTVSGNTTVLGAGRLVARGLVTGTEEFNFGNGFQKVSAIDSAGDYIYVTAAATNTLTIVDVSDPDHPRPILYTTSDLHQPIDVQIEGGLAYVVSELNNRLTIIDVSNPWDQRPNFHLESIGSTDRLLAKPQAVHVVGNHAFVASYGEDGTGLNNGLRVFDVSDPREPLNRGYTDAYLNGATDVFVAGNYAYVTSEKNNRLVVFNVSDRDVITAMGYSSNQLMAPSAVHVRGNYAYVLGGDSHNLVVFDVRDPHNITYVSHELSNLRHPRSLYLSGNNAYVAFSGDAGTNAHGGLAVFDVSDPADIKLLSEIDMTGSVPYPEKPVAITGNGRHVYVANEAHHSVAVYDINYLDAPAVVAGTVQAETLESIGDARVNQNLNVGNGLTVGPGGALVEGQLSVAGLNDNYILGSLSLGAAGLVYSDTEKTQVMYPTQQLDVHGDARVRVNENHSLIMASPPTKGAFFDFTTNDFGAYYTPTARIEFSVPDPFTGNTHTTEVKILTQSASDSQVRGRMTIGEEIVFHHVDLSEPDPDLNLRTTITLTKNGDVLPGADNAYRLGDSENRWQAVYAANGTIQTSDARWKANITDLEAGLAEIGRLRPVTFNWIDNPEDGQHFGLIAQEVAGVLPEIVEGAGQNDQPLGLNYAEVVPVLVNAVQEQQAQIGTQAEQIAVLEARLAAVEGQRERQATGLNGAYATALPWLGGLFLVGTGVVIGRRRLGGAA